MIVIPFVTRDRCQKSILILCSKLWNALSDDIVTLEFEQFRRKVYKNNLFQYLCDSNIVEILHV